MLECACHDVNHWHTFRGRPGHLINVVLPTRQAAKQTLKLVRHGNMNESIASSPLLRQTSLPRRSAHREIFEVLHAVNLDNTHTRRWLEEGHTMNVEVHAFATKP